MKRFVTLGIAFLTLCAVAFSQESNPASAMFTSLASFDGVNGAMPTSGPLIEATDGNLYGVTQSGGANNAGEVFQLTPAGELNVIYSFCSEASCEDGGTPLTGVIQSHYDGNLYGTTTAGGSHGCGTLYQLTLSGAFTVVHNFCGNANDVFNVQGSLAAFSWSIIYGTGASGGKYGAGAIFSVGVGGQYEVHHSFCSEPNCADGSTPLGGLTPMYSCGHPIWVGTTSAGGANGHGTLFQANIFGCIDSCGYIPGGTLYNFCSQANCADGAAPNSPPVGDVDGEPMYGTTPSGGANGQGVIYQLHVAKGEYSVVHDFCSAPSCADGSVPTGLIENPHWGTFFGATQGGGANQSGTIFTLAEKTNTMTTLYSFCAEAECVDGQTPTAGLVVASPGLVYGTTAAGGSSAEGTVYRIEPSK